MRRSTIASTLTNATAAPCIARYASWERGANENMNGLIRQFFPKKMFFDSITPEEITFAVDKPNHRPRKCLGFRTPHEVFIAQLQSQQNVVALKG